jgi:hypothetical protein
MDPNAILQAKYREGCTLLGDLKMQAKELAERIAVVEADLVSMRKLSALFPPARAADGAEREG